MASNDFELLIDLFLHTRTSGLVCKIISEQEVAGVLVTKYSYCLFFPLGLLRNKNPENSSLNKTCLGTF